MSHHVAILYIPIGFSEGPSIYESVASEFWFENQQVFNVLKYRDVPSFWAITVELAVQHRMDTIEGKFGNSEQ